MPPLTPQEEERLKRVERDLAALKEDVKEIGAAKDRARDQERHEWKQMLEGARRALTDAWRAEVAELKEGLELLKRLAPLADTLDAVEKRLARKEAEEEGQKKAEAQAAAVRAQLAAEQEIADRARQAQRDHRLKVWGVIVTLIGIVAGLLGAAAASHH